MGARALAGNVVWSMLNQLFARGSMTLAAIILARCFDTREFASFGYFQLTVAMLATFSVLGLGTAASKVVADHVHRAGKDGDAAFGVLWIGSVLLATTAAVLILVVPQAWIGGGLDLPRWLIAGGVFATALQAVPNGAVLGLEEFRRSALNGMWSALIVLAGAALAVAMANVRIAMYGIILASFVQGLANSVLVVGKMGASGFLARIPAAWSQIRHVLDLVLPLAAGSAIVTSGMWLVGRIILAGKDGNYAFALYSIGMQWFALAMFLPANMGTVFLPYMVKLSASQSDGRAFLRKAALSAFLASLVVATVGTFFSPLLLRMYGENYAHQTWLISAYLFAAVLTSPVTTLGNAMLANDLQWKRLALFVGWLVILLASAGALRGAVIFGGAASIAFAYVFVTAGMVVLARRRGLL